MLIDAVLVRCVLLPAALELLGPVTWRLPHPLRVRLPHINIEGTAARPVARRDGLGVGEGADPEPEATTA